LAGCSLVGGLSGELGDHFGFRRNADISLAVSHAVAAAMFRAALVLWLLHNLIPKGFLVGNLKPILARLYTAREIWSVGALLFVVGILLPLLSLIFSNSPLFMVIAVACIVIESLICRLILV
jgi:hypothetical protein